MKIKLNGLSIDTSVIKDIKNMKDNYDSFKASQAQAPEASSQALNAANQSITNQPISAAQQGSITGQPVSAPVEGQQPATDANQVPTGAVSQVTTATTDPSEKNLKMKNFRYHVINSMGKKETGTFDAESEDEVRTFLEGQDYQVLDVLPRSKMDIDVGGPAHIGPEDLSFSLTQISTYLKSGIPLVDSMRILTKQATKAGQKKVYGQVVYELLKGESFSNALAKQGSAFPKLLINMVKTAEMTGDLPSILDDMAEYYTSMNETRKQMRSAMIYPVVVLLIAIGVLLFMIVYF